MRVIVTGAAGFIGGNLVADLLELGYFVCAIDRREMSFAESEQIQILQIDLSNFNNLAKLDIDFDILFHFAAESSVARCERDPDRCIKDNVVATANLFAWAVNSKVRQVIFASSMAVYGDAREPVSVLSPTLGKSLYSMTKLTGESILNHYAKLGYFDAYVLRLFNVYGPGQNLTNLDQGMLSIYLAQALENGSVEVKGGLHRTRDFVYISDVIDAIFLVMSNSGSATYNVGTGISTSVSTALNALQSALNSHGISYERTEGNPTEMDIEFSGCDPSELNAIGWQASETLESGLIKFVAWGVKSRE